MKYPDWQERFWAAVNDACTKKFDWGTHDCVLFAAKIADAISDSGYMEMAKQSFTWTDMRGAVDITRNGLRPLVVSVLGEMRPWTVLTQGDIALVLDDEGRESLAIHDGCQVIGPAEVGVRTIPFRCVKGGWKVD